MVSTPESEMHDECTLKDSRSHMSIRHHYPLFPSTAYYRFLIEDLLDEILGSCRSRQTIAARL